MAELHARADRYPGELVSIYLGGGTPSLWDPRCIARAIAAIEERYGATPREITLEYGLEYIEEDELIEVTPENIRLRKRMLAAVDRKKAARAAARIADAS